jgi:hypothetical protein
VSLSGSSGSIVSDCGLDDRVVEVRSPTGAEDISSSLCVQTGSGAHPASYSVGTGGPFPRGVTLTTHPHLVAEVKYEQELFLLSPHVSPWRVAGHLYLYL